MRNILVVLLGVIVVVGVSLPTSSNHVYAKGGPPFGVTAYQPYDFTFHFQGEDRRIRTQAEFQQLLRDLVQYLLRLQASLGTLESDVAVTTLPAHNVTDDSAVLRGEILEFGDSDSVRVWFEYGLTTAAVSNKTAAELISDSDDTLFDARVSGLRENTKYYYRAVGRDEADAIDYGAVQNFRTDDTDEDDEPEVVTRTVTDVTDSRAVLHGTVDMQDYNNGEVFFVYGEDEDLVSEVDSSFETYEAVEEEDEDLQKVLVDSDLDDSGTYQLRITNLPNGTTQYAALCVAYEDGSESMTCGVVRSFRTEE